MIPETDGQPKEAEIIRQEVLKDFRANTTRLQEGEKITQRLLCIDERAGALLFVVDEVDGSIFYVNVPGGGLEFLSEDDIERLLRRSNGKIDIYAHKSCGWGELKMNEFLLTANNDEEGINRVMDSIKLSVQDDGFRSLVDFEDWGHAEELAREFLANKLNGLRGGEDVENPNAALFQQAFVCGKSLKLKSRLMGKYNELVTQNDASIPTKDDLEIKVHLDDMNGQPHNHIANDAVINLTGRVFASRFLVSGEKPFFADVDGENVFHTVELILKIMEGDHSDTSDTKHYIHVFHENPIEMIEIAKRLDKLVKYDKGEPRRKIVHHLVDYDPQNV